MVRRVDLYLEPLRGTCVWGRLRTPQRHCAPGASLTLRSMPLWGWGYAQPLRGCAFSKPFLAEACCTYPSQAPSHNRVHQSADSIIKYATVATPICLHSTNREAVVHTPQPHIGEAYVGYASTTLPRTAARFQLPFESLRLLGINIISFK